MQGLTVLHPKSASGRTYLFVVCFHTDGEALEAEQMIQVTDTTDLWQSMSCGSSMPDIVWC